MPASRASSNRGGTTARPAAARASVRCEIAEETREFIEEGATPGNAWMQLGELPELRDAMSLVWRILLLWLAIGHVISGVALATTIIGIPLAIVNQSDNPAAKKLVEALQAVASLDDDRVLRRMALLVGASKRTNFYQTGPDGGPKPYISFKVASGELADLPNPKPFREIFVWGVNVEGVHLRFGPVARGGLRWSDRRDDFRTEVLGLVKAQQVKNAVIVPVGSKGGFYPKQLPKGSPDAVRTEAIAAYKTFLCGLLDLTDNLTAAGKVTHPEGVIVHDGDDPYLVVAADKGTATFSDIANGVAESYGFWLGDAFASGVNDKQYTITFTRGATERLTEDEFALLAGHEIAHWYLGHRGSSVAAELAAFVRNPAFDAGAVDRAEFAVFSARESTRALAEALDLACQRNRARATAGAG